MNCETRPDHTDDCQENASNGQLRAESEPKTVMVNGVLVERKADPYFEHGKENS